MPLTDHEGKSIGLVGVQLDELPADAVCRFFATHGLFERDWNVGYVINQICELGQVHCTRRRALKYYEKSFMMGKVDIGPLLVWKMKSNICIKRDIYCERSRDIEYELKDIKNY
eukprot:scaffold3768_cov253-Chaetoceros_neogracile.AAC.10